MLTIEEKIMKNGYIEQLSGIYEISIYQSYDDTKVIKHWEKETAKDELRHKCFSLIEISEVAKDVYNEWVSKGRIGGPIHFCKMMQKAGLV